MSVELFFGADGTARAVYSDDVDLGAIAQVVGAVEIKRASHVEPARLQLGFDPGTDERGGIGWWVDMSPSGGPDLGPFVTRQAALDAEAAWLSQRLAAL